MIFTKTIKNIFKLLIASIIIFCSSSLYAGDEVRFGARSTNLEIIIIEGEFFQKYNIDPKVVRIKTGVEMGEALIGGSIDVGIVGGAPLVSALTVANNIVVLGNAWTTDGGYAKVLVKVDAPYKKILDLKGKKIANKIGSGSYRALGDWCKKNGCSYADFEILNTAPASIFAALEAGSVEAGIWFAPTTSIAVHKGIARVLGDFKGANLGQATWAGLKSFADKNPEIMSRVMAATVDAQEFILNNPEKAAEILSRGLKKRGRDIPVEVLAMGINDFHYEHGMTSKKVEVFEAIFSSAKQAGKLKGDMPDFNSVLNNSYYEAGLKLRN